MAGCARGFVSSSRSTLPSRANGQSRGSRSRATRRCESRRSSPWEATLPLFDITTGTADFIANGVISHNCFARPTHTYLDFNAREDFEREIVVKVNAPELVRAELARPSWKGDHVALGTNTDPYQWVEGRYRLMAGIWEAMRDYANPCSVLTKSPLLLRDIELMKQLVEVTEFAANLSVPTLDEKAWRETEPHTPHPRKRLEAVAELNRAGVPTSVLIAPLIPGVNDAPEQVEPLLELAGEAGARTVGGVGLHLRGEVREIWFDWLRQYRPDLIPRYQELYRRGAYMPSAERERLAAMARRGKGLRGTRRVREGDGGDRPLKPPSAHRRSGRPASSERNALLTRSLCPCRSWAQHQSWNALRTTSHEPVAKSPVLCGGRSLWGLPPMQRSRWLPPSSQSPPLWPKSRSLRFPPKRASSPFPPNRRSAPLWPWMTSVPGPP